jgi:predicted translation initiation factor SUI1
MTHAPRTEEKEADVAQQQQRTRTVLFLCADGDGRGAAAEAALAAVVSRMGLPWRGRRQDPELVGEADAADAALIVAPDEAARQRLEERFPACGGRVRCWGVAPGAPPADVEHEVLGLVAVLLGGKAEAPASPATAPAAEPAKKKPAERPTVRVGRETSGRRGKGVTTVWDLPLSADEIEQLAARLKQKCGTGGTVKGGVIEIQGDHRDRLVGELEALGYRVKRSGG